MELLIGILIIGYIAWAIIDRVKAAAQRRSEAETMASMWDDIAAIRAEADSHMSRLTAKEAACWLSGDWGKPVSVDDVRMCNGWVFVLDGDNTACIFAEGIIEGWGAGEWAYIPTSESPFAISDADVMRVLTDKLTVEYLTHLEQLRKNSKNF